MTVAVKYVQLLDLIPRLCKYARRNDVYIFVVVN